MRDRERERFKRFFLLTSIKSNLKVSKLGEEKNVSE